MNPRRDAWLAVLVVVVVAALHAVYVHAQVIDLAEDEAYYWDWSRHLDASYYSKGPGTAWLIRASCAVFGDTPLGVRFPAIVARAGVGLCMFWLTWRLFGSSRLGLGAMLLGYAAPIFLAAGLIMTTDPAYLLSWGVATCLAARAIWDGRRWAFVAAGAVVGFGFLSKFAMPLWFVGLFAFLILDREARVWLGTRWPWLGVLVAGVFTLPVMWWNHRNGWVTMLHVGADIGVTRGDFDWKNFTDFWLGQLGVAGPVFLLIATAVIWAVGRAVGQAASDEEREEANPLVFLLTFGLPVFVGVMLSSLRKHPSANWCASSYFALIILAAAWVAQSGRWAKALAGVCVVLGLAIVGVAHNTEALYPMLPWVRQRFPEARLAVRRIDPTYRVHGWAELGRIISDHREKLPSDALVLAHDYQTAAELAFYMRGQPRTRTAGAYLRPPFREPYSQYDLWKHRRLDDPALVGRSAIYVGPMPWDMREAFEEVRQLDDVVIVRGGERVRRFYVYECRGFKGLKWRGWNGRYNKSGSW